MLNKKYIKHIATILEIQDIELFSFFNSSKGIPMPSLMHA